MSVNHSVMSVGIIEVSLLYFTFTYLFDFLIMTLLVCCVFSLESPHRSNSNEYTQHTIISIKKENHSKLFQMKSCL